MIANLKDRNLKEQGVNLQQQRAAAWYAEQLIVISHKRQYSEYYYFCRPSSFWDIQQLQPAAEAAIFEKPLSSYLRT